MKKRVEPKAIREIMTASPITVYPDTSIRELKILFERYPVNALPVVDDQGVLRASFPDTISCESSAPTRGAGSRPCSPSGPSARKRS